MHILYLSQYFPPEVGATQTRAHEMAVGLIRAGHHVTMISEVPNHPSGIIPPAYKGKLFEQANLDGIDVIRVWVKTSPVKNMYTRLAFYLSYMIHATLAGVLLGQRPYDLIYATSPPLFVGGAGLVLSFIYHIPMTFEVRDLWPESAGALGEILNPKAFALATKLEEACYRRAKAIVVVTQGILNRLIERNIPAYKLALIPNGANVDLFQFRPEGRARIRNTFGLGEKFVAIYAGIHGVAQGLERVIETAQKLQSDPGSHFLMVGDGPKKRELVELATQYALSNVTFIPAQPRERIPDYLSAADVALIPLKNLDLFKSALPSKMFDAWACQRPVLLSVDGEARSVLKKAEGGLFVSSEDVNAMAKALLDFKKDPLLRETMGQRGRTFTERYYSRQAQATQLVHLLEQILLDRK
jgi:glycosyltransferase involved in cell wall biosynthesis